MVENTRGMVYREGGRLRGCSYANGRVSVLPAQGPMEMGDFGGGVATIDAIAISGRFVGYGSHWIRTCCGPGASQGPPRTERVISFDLKAGKIKYATTPNDNRPRTSAIVVKSNGSVAWIYVYEQRFSDTVVAKMDRATGGDERGLDHNERLNPSGDPKYTIDANSLALRTDRTRIYWTATLVDDPEPHYLSAPLE
ncbi:MAG: hypothetical protein ACJ760_11745 [Thermoleophilaceae bacterium]